MRQNQNRSRRYSQERGEGIASDVNTSDNAIEEQEEDERQLELDIEEPDDKSQEN